MARPATVPRWAMEADETPAANISEPSSGHKDTGWVNSEVPPSAYENWLQYWYSRWLKWLDEAWPVEHDDDGHHTDVTADSLTLDGADPIAYTTSRVCTFNLGSPEKGDWQVIVGVLGTDFAYNTGGTPSNTACAGATTFTAARSLSMLFAGQSDGSVRQWKIKTIDMQYRENAAGDAVTVAVYSYLNSGTASRTVELAPVNLAATGGGYTNNNAFTGTITIEPDRVYWVEVVCTATAANRAGFANVIVGVERTKVE